MHKRKPTISAIEKKIKKCNLRWSGHIDKRLETARVLMYLEGYKIKEKFKKEETNIYLECKVRINIIDCGVTSQSDSK